MLDLILLMGALVVFALFVAVVVDDRPVSLILWTVLRAVAHVSALLGLALGVITARAWRDDCWTMWAKLRQGLATVAAVGLIPFLTYWQLLP